MPAELRPETDCAHDASRRGDTEDRVPLPPIVSSTTFAPRDVDDERMRLADIARERGAAVVVVHPFPGSMARRTCRAHRRDRLTSTAPSATPPAPALNETAAEQTITCKLPPIDHRGEIVREAGRDSGAFDWNWLARTSVRAASKSLVFS